MRYAVSKSVFFFFQAEDGIRDKLVTGVQTCALPISNTQWRRGASTAEHYSIEQRLGHVEFHCIDFDRVGRARLAGGRSEERRVGKRVDLGGRRIIKKKKKK